MAVIETSRKIIGNMVILTAQGTLNTYTIKQIFNHAPTTTEIDNFSTNWRNELERQETIQKNPFNNILFQTLINYTKEILIESINYIKANPSITETDFVTWFTTNHPNSSFNITNLLNVLYEAIGTTLGFAGLVNFILNNIFEV